MEIKVAACQILTYSDVKKNTEKIIEWISKASEQNIDVVAFPEASLCGYTSDEKYWKSANPEDFLNCEQRIIQASREFNIAVVLGTAHWHEGEVFNSLLAIEKGGIIRGRYSKTHLAEAWPAPGKSLSTYTLAGVESCFIICHDIRYPELVRLPAISGAQICYFCSNESGLTLEHKLSAYRAMPIARATENGIFLVMTNAPADPDDLHNSSQSHGNSKIIHPDGNILCEAGFFEESLVTWRINLDEATRAFAQRSVDDDTIFREWMKKGVEFINS